MKRRSGIFLLLFLLSAGIFYSSCSEKEATTGNLTVAVIDSTGAPIPEVYVHLALSLADLKQHNFLMTGYTTSEGKATFSQLEPDIYWYTADNFKDLGAIQVYAAKDYYVTLYENSPGNK